MLLTITTTHIPATDLGYLLAKNPARSQSFEVSQGTVHVFYAEASETRCTAALLLDMDPVTLVRGRGSSAQGGGTLAEYVNDRPYSASSFLSVAMAQVFSSAMKGASKERPELAQTPIPLEVCVSAISCRGGAGLLRELFEPLGYEVETRPLAQETDDPEWRPQFLYGLTLRGCVRLADVLTHLYVLIPVLDRKKHYYVGDDEVDKLIHRGGDWLQKHPKRDWIVRGYLKNRTSLMRSALERLGYQEDGDGDELDTSAQVPEYAMESSLSLHEQRIACAVDLLRQRGARRVLDLGCGEGKLVRELLKHGEFEHILGVDVSYRSLEIATERLRLDEMHEMQRSRVEFVQGSVTYRDSRFSNFDAACAIEVIEHIEPSRLPAFERVVFEFAQPKFVLITTPNMEYNGQFPTLSSGRFRHPDHRFEWTRAEFQIWAEGVASRYGYAVNLSMIGPDVEGVGAPSQMAAFAR